MMRRIVRRAGDRYLGPIGNTTFSCRPFATIARPSTLDDDTLPLSSLTPRHEATSISSTIRDDAPLMNGFDVGLGSVGPVLSALEQSTETFLHKVPVGSLQIEAFSQARRLIIVWARKRTPDAMVKAEALLDRMVEECSCNRYKFQMSPALYNQVMDGWLKSGAPKKHVERVLNKMKKNSKQPGSPSPVIMQYNVYLKALAKDKTDPDAAQKAISVIEYLEDCGDPNLEPDEYTYNNLISVFAERASDHYGYAQKAEDLLLRISELSSRQQNSRVRLSSISFNIVLKAWAESEEDKAPDRALEILKLMLNFRDERRICPDSVSFSIVCHAFGKRGMAWEAAQVLELMDDVVDVFPDDPNLISPFNAVMNAWSKSGDPDAGIMAERVLKKAAEYKSVHPRVEVVPDAISYITCLSAHIRAEREDGAERADQLLRRVVDTHQSGLSYVRPVADMFHTVMAAWSEKGEPDRVRQLFDLMLQLSASDRGLVPNDHTVYRLMEASAKKTGSVERPLEMLSWVETLEQAGRIQLQGPYPYSSIIGLLWKDPNKDDEMKAAIALDVFKRAETKSAMSSRCWKLDIVTCNMTLALIARSKSLHMALEASKILEGLEWRFQAGETDMEPDVMAYGPVLKALSFVSDKLNETHLRLGIQVFEKMNELDNDPERSLVLQHDSYENMLRICANVHHSPMAANYAERITNHMLEQRTVGAGISSAGLSSCVLAIHRSGDTWRAYQKLMEFLSLYRDGRFLENYPHPACATSLLNNLAHIQHPAALQQAREVQRAYGVLLGFNVEFLKGFMNVLARHGMGGEAENFMKSQSERDVNLWNVSLFAWSRTQTIPKSQRMVEARRCLDEMISESTENGVEPDSFSYCSVINAAAIMNGTSKDNELCRSLATQTYEEAKSRGVTIDHVMYGMYIKTLRKTMDPAPERTKAIRNILDEAKSRGQVGRLMMKELSRMTELEQDELGISEVVRAYKGKSNHHDSLPYSWTENVKD